MWYQIMGLMAEIWMYGLNWENGVNVGEWGEWGECGEWG